RTNSTRATSVSTNSFACTYQVAGGTMSGGAGAGPGRQFDGFGASCWRVRTSIGDTRRKGGGCTASGEAARERRAAPGGGGPAGRQSFRKRGPRPGERRGGLVDRRASRE